MAGGNSLCAFLARTLFRPPSCCAFPQLRINGHDMHTSALCVVEGSMVADLSIAEEPGHHRKRTRGEDLIGIGFLTLECFDGAAAW